MHGVRARGKGLPRFAAVGRGACFFTVHHVGGDRQHRERGFGSAIQRMACQLVVKRFGLFAGNGVHAIVIVAEGGVVSLHLEIRDEACSGVADAAHLRVLNGRE